MHPSMQTVSRLVHSHGAPIQPWPAPRQLDPMTRTYWPGMSRGVRAPEAGETPLSWDEVEHGVKAGVL